MKKSGLFAASMAAASATAYSASSTSIRASNPHEDAISCKKGEKSASETSNSSNKFAPRFDGLRFIETLVTAHR